MEVSTIKELKAGMTNKVVELKVYRAWTARDPPSIVEKGYRAILLDRQGDAIQGNVEADDIEHFKGILIPGQAYRISDFECVKTENWQRTLENPTSLQFSRTTKFDTITSETFPLHYFNFISYNQLPSRIVDSKDKSNKAYPILTDYIGCYVNSGEVETIGSAMRNQYHIRRVGIENLNRNFVELTLWDHLAHTFPKDAIDKLERPIIIAVSSCKVSRYRDRALQLSSTPATYYYINPRIPQLAEFQREYKQIYENKPPLDVIRYRLNDPVQEKKRNRFSLSQLLTQRPETYEGVRFTCEGTIISLNTDRDWYYSSCTKCNLKPRKDDDVYKCKEHGVIESTVYKYNFKVSITDTTEVAQFTFFTPKADAIVGIDCPSLIKTIADPDPRIFPPEIRSVIGQQHIFQFYFSPTCREGAIEFILSDILDNIDQPQQPEDHPHNIAGSSETPPAIEYTPIAKPLLEKSESSKQPTDQLPDTIAATSSATEIVETPTTDKIAVQHSSDIITTTADTTQTVTTPTKEKTAAEHPSDLKTTPTSYTVMQTRSKTDMGTDTSQKTAKRVLFPEETMDLKKKKN